MAGQGWRDNGVDQNTEAGSSDGDVVAGDERAHSRGCAGEYQVAGLEGDGGGDVGEELGDGEDEVGGGAVLAKLAVDAGFDDEAGGGIDFVADPWADGTERVETLGASPLAVFLLQVAGGDVVGEGVAANDGAQVEAGFEFAGSAADHDGEFAFMIDAR